MPIVMWVERARRVRYSVASEVVTDRQFIEVYGGVVEDPTNDPTLNHLADFTAVERFEVTPKTLQRTAWIMKRHLDV